MQRVSYGSTTRLQRELAARGSSSEADAGSPGKQARTDAFASSVYEPEREKKKSSADPTELPTPPAVVPVDAIAPAKPVASAAAAGAAPAKPIPRLELRPAAKQTAKPQAAHGLGGSADASTGAHDTHAAHAAHRRPGTIGVAVQQTAPGDPSPTRTTVGVGERVQLTGDGEGAWQATRATGAATGAGATFAWQAPDQPGAVTISHEREGHPAQTVQMTVVAPQRADFRKLYDVPQEPAGVGMVTNLTFQPNTVSFDNAEWLEQPGSAENLSGYFEAYRTATGHDLMHHPYGQWLPMRLPGQATNSGVDDTAFTGDKPRLGSPAQWSEGAFEWNIPNKYRVAGQGDGYPFQTVNQHFHMEGGANAGRMTVTKGGQSATQTPAGLTEGGGPSEQFPTLASAIDAFTRSEGDAQRTGYIQGLRFLTLARARDSASYANLVSAAGIVQPPQLIVYVRCTNSYSWIDSDSGELVVAGNRAGQSRPIEVDTGHFREFRFEFRDLFDVATFQTTSALSFNLTIEGHTMAAMMGYPFSALGQATPLAGSDGRYTLRSFFASQSQG